MAPLLKLAAFLVALGGIVLGFMIWPKTVSAYDECRHLIGSTNTWLACINGTNSGVGGARAVAIANVIGGLLSGLVLFAIGHVVDRVDILHAQLLETKSQMAASADTACLHGENA